MRQSNLKKYRKLLKWIYVIYALSAVFCVAGIFLLMKLWPGHPGLLMNLDKLARSWLNKTEWNQKIITSGVGLLSFASNGLLSWKFYKAFDVHSGLAKKAKPFIAIVMAAFSVLGIIFALLKPLLLPFFAFFLVGLTLLPLKYLADKI